MTNKINADKQNITQSVQTKIGNTARGMLDGSIHYLEGALDLNCLRHEIGAYENDPDFIAFVGVSARINHLSIDISKVGWAALASAEQLKEVEKSIDWAKEFSLSQCESLAHRYI